MVKIRVKIEERVYEVEVVEVGNGCYRATIDGDKIDVKVEGKGRGVPEDRKVGSGVEEITTVSDSPGKNHFDITSPMPGIITSILVKEGMSIKKGQEVVVMETMKMDVPIFSPGNGKVVNIRVEVGQAVGAGDILIECQ